MATVGSISINLVAKTAAFTAGMNLASRGVRGLVGEISTAGAKVVGFGSAALTAAAGGGIAFLTAKSFENIAATSRMADRFGIATDKLGALQHAAKLTGADSEMLGTALQRMSKNAVDAADMVNRSMARRGTNAVQIDTGATEAFKRLNVDLGEFVKLSPDQQLRKIADGMKNIHNQTERVGIALNIFGRGGGGMVNLLQQGSAGLDKMEADARKLGVAINGIDSAKIELANTAWRRMQEVITGVFNSIAINLAPFVTELIDDFVGAATAGDDMGDRVGQAFNIILKGIAKVADYLSLLKAGFLGVKSIAMWAMQGVEGAVWLVAKGLDGVVMVLQKIAESGVFVKVFGKGMAEGLKSTHQIITNFADAAKENMKSFGQSATDSFTAAENAIDDFNNGKNSKAVDNWVDRVKKKQEQAAKDLAKTRVREPAEIPDDVVKKTGDFAQAKLSRVAFDLHGAGTAGNGPSTARQAERQINLLEVIAKYIRGGVPAKAT